MPYACAPIPARSCIWCARWGSSWTMRACAAPGWIITNGSRCRCTTRCRRR
ncbi:Uncharacterised protein [Bordetella pertussis]|nr:Uncharacterised protein [Bordetella pertussis]